MERAKITEGGVAFLIFAGCYPKDPACIEQYRDLPRVSSIKDQSFRPKDHPKYQAWNCFGIFYYVFHIGGICIIPILQSNNVCILPAAPNILKHTNASFLTLFEQRTHQSKPPNMCAYFFLDPPPPHPKKKPLKPKKQQSIIDPSCIFHLSCPGLWSMVHLSQTSNPGVCKSWWSRFNEILPNTFVALGVPRDGGRLVCFSSLVENIIS